jgi:hypothetical protein
MIFACDSAGEVTSWSDLYCHRGWQDSDQTMEGLKL